MIRLPSSAVAALVLIWVFPVLVRSAEISDAANAANAANGVFSCRGRPAGYYADLQSGCQRYYMCDAGGRRYSYACPNQTLFQQRVMICDHWFMVDCSLSESFFGANSLLGQSGKQFVSDNDQFFQRTQEESALRRRPGARRPVDRTSAAYLASVAQRPSTAASGAGTPAPDRGVPRTLPAAYANNPFFRGLTADTTNASSRAVTAPVSTSSAAFQPVSTTGATFRPTLTTGATFRPTLTTGATFRPTTTTPPPRTTAPRDRYASTQNVHELLNRFASRHEEAAPSTPRPARPTPTSGQIVVTRQGQSHHFAKDAAQLRDELSTLAPSSSDDADLDADTFTTVDPFTTVDAFRGADAFTRTDAFGGGDPFRGTDVFRRVDAWKNVDVPTGADPLIGADPLTGADAFTGADPLGADPLGADVSAAADAERELLTNTLELRLPDTRRMFFIADNPLREAEMLRANNETVLRIALSQPLHHGPMRFKGARSPKGQRSGCPQCHPAFLLPGTCEPCVLIR